jgi:hypothetical protein
LAKPTSILLGQKDTFSAGADCIKRLRNAETMQKSVQLAQSHHKIIFNAINQLRDNGQGDGMQEKQHQSHSNSRGEPLVILV